MKYENFYLDKKKIGRLDQLAQLVRITWDGDLISKSERDHLVKEGFAAMSNGFNIITPLGIEYLHNSKILIP